MTDNANTPNAPRAKTGKGRRRFMLAAVALAAALTGGVAASAFGGHGFGHGGGFMHGQLDPATVEKRATRMIKHLAVEVDATKEQQDKLIAIVTATAKDLLPMREQFRSARLKGRELLLQPQIDRVAIEKLRADQLARADAASRRAVQALTDAAEVLTPQQRQTLAKRVDRFRSLRGCWHRG